MPNYDLPLKVGLFSTGLEAYWPQFPGLKDRLNAYNRCVESRLARSNVQVVNFGLIDSPEKAMRAGHEFRRADVDLIFLHVATYALSSTVLPVVRRAKLPVVILNLSPGAAIDYASFNRMRSRRDMTGEWLAWCGACPVPEIANVFTRSGIPFFQITGALEDDPAAWTEIDEWVQAARAAHTMEHNRLGAMGRYYGGMLDVYSDLTLQCATFGGHIELIEVDELTALRASTKSRMSRQ
jgi:L-arabinose isomerase